MTSSQLSARVPDPRREVHSDGAFRYLHRSQGAVDGRGNEDRGREAHAVAYFERGTQSDSVSQEATPDASALTIHNSAPAQALMAQGGTAAIRIVRHAEGLSES